MSTEIKFDEFLQKLYYNPSSGYKSANSLYKIAQEKEPKITLELLKNLLIDNPPNKLIKK